METIRNLKFEFLPRYLTVPTAHTATFMHFVYLKRHYTDASLAVMKKLKKLCTHGFGNNLKTSSPFGIRKLVDCYKKCVELNRDYVAKL